jgi:excisionase family DNA binding protein
MPPILVDVHEAARLLSVSVTTVRRLLSDGTLPRVRVGAAVRIRRSDVMAMADGAARHD